MFSRPALKMQAQLQENFPSQAARIATALNKSFFQD